MLVKFTQEPFSAVDMVSVASDQVDRVFSVCTPAVMLVESVSRQSQAAHSVALIGGCLDPETSRARKFQMYIVLFVLLLGTG